ncbi:Cyst wall protein [Spironucleus salmonicida]|uniref:Cyst wall protein n=1 Tax=Spironucleus salmonicida TaxID=348837 RepID=V6LU10_9EUKA|nr:Cyst wall protein [Spironucleus salmonicida]|eukprot:EST44274.1 Cyst wall protein [Spironucleus salmonicida]
MISILAVLTQRQALDAIYAANGGASWKGSVGWNTSASVCAWAGVTCNSQGYIVGLDLSGFGLTGQLADVFDSFPVLKSLYMNDQKMNTAIPASFCTLRSLQYLQANNAGITGAIPQCICNLAFVQFVYMSDNDITGTIPTCMGNLLFLKELHLACNQLTGTIPTGFVALKFLIEVHVQCNADLSCESGLATRPNFIFKCGLENCDDCVIPDTNCPPSVIVPDCGVYVRQ